MNIAEYLNSIGEASLVERKVLRGTTRLLNGRSLLPLLDLLHSGCVDQLEDEDAGWILSADGWFINPKSPAAKQGYGRELENYGDVFWGQNSTINPYYQGPVIRRYVDQHDLVDGLVEADVTRTVRSGEAYSRSKKVREAVLQRADGFCELCDEEGFLTVTNHLYLETHHVVPLSEGGVDSTSNVVALCPRDHKRAHFAKDRESIRKELLKILEGKRGRLDP